MVQIDLKKIPWSYKEKTIVISEKDVMFSVDYRVLSPTGNTKDFKFNHSTGGEFDPNTKWIYKSEDGLELAVCNDANMVKVAADAYLKAKLRKN